VVVVSAAGVPASEAASSGVTAAAKGRAPLARRLSARSERINDDVEDLAVVAVVLDVPLKVRRGVALARRLRASWTSLRAP
jgi:hypothetical protein